jgi:hypothetical protein
MIERLWLDTRLPGERWLRPSLRGEASVRVPEVMRKCVCFIFHEKSGGSRVPVGTAFFMSVDRTHHQKGHWGFLVTARHVLAGIVRCRQDGEFFLRFNATEGGVAWMESNIRDWHPHPDESLADDVSVLPFVPPREIESLSLHVSAAATPAIIAEHDIGVGDELFFPGLFINHHGKERNIPIVRGGSIAAMPGEPIKTKHFGSLEAYLVEARSIGGLSGSPVFVHLGLHRWIDGQIKQAITGGPAKEHGIFFLLGLVHGHYTVKAAARDEAVPDGLSDEAINQGIAIVVPVSRILENINRPEWVEMRDKHDKEAADALLPDADTGAAGEERREEDVDEEVPALSTA